MPAQAIFIPAQAPAIPCAGKLFSPAGNPERTQVLSRADREAFQQQ
jgi:hypothetical protein